MYCKLYLFVERIFRIFVNLNCNKLVFVTERFDYLVVHNIFYNNYHFTSISYSFDQLYITNYTFVSFHIIVFYAEYY